MNRFYLSLLLAGSLICSAVWAQNPPAPRASAKDYASSVQESQYSIGARLLSKTQVQNSFATPLSGRYLVVEVGFFPADGKSIGLQSSGFSLRGVDAKSSVTPASPEEIASILQKTPKSSRDVTLYPTANVGYESWPVYTGTGVKRVGGPVYGAGMGVGIDPKTSQATTDSDRKTMQTELADKSLKSGDVSSPVAGYLYFPMTGKDKDLRLQYQSADTTSSLPLTDK
jgi:hypothetical protein